MTRFPVLFILAPVLSMTFTSCDKYEEDAVCTCPHGGSIDGWEEPDDTTSVHQNDTTGGFEITLEDWGNTETHDISL